MLTNELPRSREITHKPLLNSKRGFVNHHFKSSSVHFNRPSLLWGVILSFVKLFLQGDVDLQHFFSIRPFLKRRAAVCFGSYIALHMC